MDKKIDIIGVSSILFVAMLTTVAVGTGQIGGDWSFSGGSEFGSGGIGGDSSIGVGSSGEFEGHSSIGFGGEFDGHSSVGGGGDGKFDGHSSGGSVHKETGGHSSVETGSNGKTGGHSSVGGESNGKIGDHSSIGGGSNRKGDGHSAVDGGSNANSGGHSSVGGGGNGKSSGSNGESGGHSSVGGGGNGKSGGHSSVSGGSNGKSGGHSSVNGGGNGKSGGHSSVSGDGNGKSGGHSSVSGDGNGKSGGQSSVSGDGNGKTGGHSSVSGHGNPKNSGHSSVSGGGNGKSGGHSSESDGGNSKTGGHSSASGGGNGKTGGHSSVSGGGNGKTGGHSSVSGGGNSKSGGHSSVSGGSNSKSGSHSSVSGGGNGKSGGQSSVSGDGNSKSGGHSSVSGRGNAKSGGHSSVTGGGNAKSGGPSSASGDCNGESGGHSSVGGGGNGKSGGHSAVGGGGNANSGGHSSVSGGSNGKSGDHLSISGGSNGKSGGHSSVGGGGKGEGHSSIGGGGKGEGHSSVGGGGNGNGNGNGHSSVGGSYSGNFGSHSSVGGSHKGKSGGHSSVGGGSNGEIGDHSSVGVSRNRKSGPNPKSGGIDGLWSAGFGSNQGSGGIGGQWSIGVGSNQGSGKIGGPSSGFFGFSAASTIVQQICQPTDYKEACAKTLSAACGSITDPRELIKIVFTLTVKHISEAISNSTILKKVQKDLRISDAIDNCHELLEYSIGDLERSAERMVNIDLTKMAEHTNDLKTWLSGAITYQQTCLDGFDNTTGNIGNEMRKLLAFSGELTSNGLAIVTELNKIFSFFKLGASASFAASSQAKVVSSEIPDWSNGGQRRLLAATTATVKPNVVVAKDGSGKYKTIGEALKEVQKKSNSTFVIYIKAGVYEEYISINKSMRGVYLLGDGPTKTKITGSRSYVGGYNTFRTPTVAASGDFFMAKDIGFENTAGPQNHQAVALRVSGDRSVIYNCKIDGYQDTLYAHAHRQFYRDCTITGTVDFVFGDAAAVFQNCRLIVRKPLENQNCMVTAQGRKDKRGATGLVLQNCTVTGSQEYVAARAGAGFKSFLGRPWKNYSRTVVMQSEIDGIIDPSGWAPWLGSVNLDTCWYAEFGNRGPGSSKDKRVMWHGVQKSVVQDEAASFTAARFIDGDSWIPATGVPYVSGMISV